MLIYRKHLITKMECWFKEESLSDPSDVDIIYYYFQKKVPETSSIQVNDVYTIVIDLEEDKDILWRKIDGQTRRHISRAEKKDDVEYEFLEKINQATLESFADFYDVFASHQGLSRVDRNLLKAYWNVGALSLSRMKSGMGLVFSWHSWLVWNGRAYGMHFPSHRNTEDSSYRNMIGRINRYHYWRDILQFKDMGISTFDFGGWYSGNTNKKLLNINRFKEGFGGEVLREFNYRKGISFKGKLFLEMRDLTLHATKHIDHLKSIQ